MTTEYQETLDGLKNELLDWMKENPGNSEPNDTIFELADSGVPVYTSDLLQWACDYCAFATNEPELGPAFDGSPTPTNIIAANIFESLESDLWEFYYEHENDYLDDEDEDE